MPMVMASNWSITSLLSISPANRLIVGNVVTFPPVIVTDSFCALRNPLAVARTVYVPSGAVRLKTPVGSAGTDAINLLVASYNLTMTGSVASTCPVRVPVSCWVGVVDAVAVDVMDGVAVSVEVNVTVGVADVVAVGVDDGVGVCEAVGVGGSVDGTTNVGVCEAGGVIIPPIVRVAGPVEGKEMMLLSPFEARALHSTVVCPDCSALTSKVKAVPLVVALLPLLPATATIKLPF